MGKLTVKDLFTAQRKKQLELGPSCNQQAPGFSYISAKAARYLAVPKDIYKKGDYFGYPLDEWSDEKLRLGCEKIIYNCSGINECNAFTGLSVVEIKNLLELFHFSCCKTEKTGGEDEMYKLYFRHKIDGREYDACCRNNANNEEIAYFNLLVDDILIKVSYDDREKIVKIYTDNNDLGVRAEYAYIKMYYGNLKRKKQELRKRIINNEPTWVDILYLEKDNEQYEQVFDISDFYK